MRRPSRALPALAAVGLALASTACVTQRGKDNQEPEQPEPIERPRLDVGTLVTSPEDGLRLPRGEGTALEDVYLAEDDYRAHNVRTGDDGSLYLVVGQNELGPLYGFVLRAGDDLVVDAAERFVDDDTAGQIAVAPDGSVAQFGAGSVLLDFDPDTESDYATHIFGFGASADYTADGTLIASASNQPLIVAFGPDESRDPILVSTSSDHTAPVRFDSETATLSVVVLDDGRILFATNAPDEPDLDGRLFTLDDGAMQPLDVTGADPIRRIFPGPDGTVLALEGPNISQVDIATGTTEQLVDLSEVADELVPASDDWPQPHQEISAAALGDDLYFTADYQLWRVPDAFA